MCVYLKNVYNFDFFNGNILFTQLKNGYCIHNIRFNNYSVFFFLLYNSKNATANVDNRNATEIHSGISYNAP